MAELSLLKLREELGDLIEQHDASPGQLAAWNAEYGADERGPERFGETVLGVTSLWHKQREFLRLAASNRLTAAVSANGIGKSFALAVFVLFHLFCCAPSAALTLAPTEAQNGTLWRTIRSLWLGAKVPLPGQLRTQGIDIAPQHFATGRATTEVSRLTGLHHPRLAVCLDESQGFEIRAPWVWEAVFALASGEQNKVVAIGNPGPRSGRWFDLNQSAAWARICISASEHPNVQQSREVIAGAVSARAVADIAREFGADSGVYRVRVLGEFADDAVAALTQRGHYDAAVKRWHDATLAVAQQDNPWRVGVDIARAGPDRTALAIARNGHVKALYTVRLPDLTQVTDWVVDRLRENGFLPDEEHTPRHLLGCGTRNLVVTVDANALGGGPADELERRGWPIDRFYGQGAATEPTRFANRRAEYGWGVRVAMQEGRLALPPVEGLAEELLAQQYVHRPDGRVILDPKDDVRRRLGGKSPDLFDALMMAAGGTDSFAGIAATAGCVDL